MLGDVISEGVVYKRVRNGGEIVYVVNGVGVDRVFG